MPNPQTETSTPSETPRTDRFIPTWHDKLTVLNHARQLERELIEAKERYALVTTAHENGIVERDQLRTENAELRRQVEEANYKKILMEAQTRTLITIRNELEQERATLKAQLEQAQSAFWNQTEVEKERTELKAQLAAAQNDKERLDWLENSNHQIRVWPEQDESGGVQILDHDSAYEEPPLRTAIDAAITAQTEGKQ